MEENQNPLLEIREGIELPGLKKRITQQNINLYAEASQDFNPVHVNEEFARKTPLGGTIAHGMLILAYVSQMMTDAFGPRWLVAGKLNVRFKAAARPGDTMTVGGRISRIKEDEGQTIISCDVLCSNDEGEPVISGEASLVVKTDENSSCAGMTPSLGWLLKNIRYLKAD
ncbi:MAG: MaoC family dehydratase [Dehalococcoidales bacterium]|jgi:3-hydroxybutyryl-CoA dehydratase|nr:MaoC family dehydratase [Dehalococcoidales bacterium]MDP6631915.1 MaoC family dehydratase [Dehalococcoidales bacterium]|tara:strand:+ start:66 stop:575 length:510 start_codon:yes stop_codon:yes gene_type:complete